MVGRGAYVQLQSDDGGEFPCYVSVPEHGAGGPGLVLCIEMFGLNDNMRQLADMFADQGYISLVPDLYWRLGTGLDIPYEESQKALALSNQVDVDLATQDVMVAVRHITTLSDFRGKIGTIGFCLGGRLAFLSAARGGDLVSCAVSYYGVKLDLSISEAPNVKCPIMFHFGGKDPVISAEVIKIVEEAFKGKENAEVFVYPEAGHGFGSPFRTDGHYMKEPADLALKRTLALFTKTLKE